MSSWSWPQPTTCGSIEDNCDALGSRYRGRLTGTFGHLATSSFYPAHHITMGEGGAVVTNDDLLARIARSFRDWGRDCYCAGGENNTCGTRFSQQFGTLPRGFDHKYVYSHLGYNLKVTDMQAAIGCAQLKKLDGFIASRKANFARLTEVLEPYADRLLLPSPRPTRTRRGSGSSSRCVTAPGSPVTTWSGFSKGNASRRAACLPATSCDIRRSRTSRTGSSARCPTAIP